MSKQFQVEANGTVFGTYEAADAQGARDACAVDAGYKSEADMVEQLDQPSELVATEVERVTFEGRTIDLAAARMLMDDELCEAIHGTVETDQDFLDAYLAAHAAKYGEQFSFA